ncbi:transposase [Streptomyces griseoincarnatus]
MTTQAGALELAIPKLRAGSFFPSLLKRRRHIDQALYTVAMEAYVHGVSTRYAKRLDRSADNQAAGARDAPAAPFRHTSGAARPSPPALRFTTYQREVGKGSQAISQGSAGQGQRTAGPRLRVCSLGRPQLDPLPCVPTKEFEVVFPATLLASDRKPRRWRSAPNFWH